MRHPRLAQRLLPFPQNLVNLTELSDEQLLTVHGALPFMSSSFDVVLAFTLLERLDADRVLREFSSWSAFTRTRAVLRDQSGLLEPKWFRGEHGQKLQASDIIKLPDDNGIEALTCFRIAASSIAPVVQEGFARRVWMTFLTTCRYHSSLSVRSVSFRNWANSSLRTSCASARLSYAARSSARRRVSLPISPLNILLNPHSIAGITMPLYSSLSGPLF